ncbi:SEC-C motif domain protein (fragment) [Corynebacterium striatum]
MAKKKKNNEQLPEGMSRRQAKLAARAAERAALEKDPRPFGGLAAEASLVAMQEFVPSATAKLSLKGFDKDVYVSTVLPGASAALIRDEEFGGEASWACRSSPIPTTLGATSLMRLTG